MDNKTQVSKRWEWKNWAMINECCSDIPSVAFHAQDETIDYLEAENERLKQDCIDLVDLGTDQFVTEKIVRLEKENERLKQDRQ